MTDTPTQPAAPVDPLAQLAASLAQVHTDAKGRVDQISQTLAAKRRQRRALDAEIRSLVAALEQAQAIARRTDPTPHTRTRKAATK